MNYLPYCVRVVCIAVAQTIAFTQVPLAPAQEPALAEPASLQNPVAHALTWVALPAAGKPVELASARFDGAGQSETVFFQQDVRVPGWRWMRVYFKDCDLGEGSHIRLTSLKDGDVQILDSAGMHSWRGASAYFNGDAVRVELMVHPADRGVFVQLAGVTGDESGGKSTPPVKGGSGNGPAPRTLCGTDERLISFDARVCRIAKDTGNTAEPFAWCTGWQVSNGALLTAGHCVDDNLDGVVDADFLGGVIQFNVPASDCDGAPNHPPAADQYPIDAVTAFSWFGDNVSIGRDWAVMSVLPDGNGLPHVSRGWFRMTNELPETGANIRVTGFGTDSTPAGCTGELNAQNQTNQTAYGPFTGETADANGISLQYAVDTTGGNSGSPIIVDGANITIGIHTNGGCSDNGSGNNNGSSFENDALENAIGGFPGPNARYVDAAFPMNVTRNGTIFRPWATFALGVSGVPTGGVLTVVAGTYNEPVNIGRAMTIRAPVGMVTVGQ